MTRWELIINILTDPHEDDLHELYNHAAHFLLSTLVAGCMILSIQKWLR